jgi:hypothetical protein
MTSRLKDRNIPLYALFCLILILNIGYWYKTRDLLTQWSNVPPVTSQGTLERMGLSDAQFSYRLMAMFVQNFGSTGGRDQHFSLYDYGRLSGWMRAGVALDPKSNLMPALAAYYYGAVNHHDNFRAIVDFLAEVGQQPQPHKWRWLAHAVYLARYQMNDLAYALELAEKLAALPRDDLPFWARQMPAFVMSAQGDKAAAYALMMGVLATEAQNLNPTEVRFIRDYICDQLLTPDQAAAEGLCAATR